MLGGIFQCRQKQMKHEVSMVLKCCSGQSRCNQNLILEFPTDEQIKYGETCKLLLLLFFQLIVSQN